jgi:hypothetical protein
VCAKNAIVAQRVVIGIGNANVDIKVKVVGVKIPGLFDDKGVIRW